LFRLTTERRQNKFVKNILLESETADEWPILELKLCPCGYWIKRAQLFDNKELKRIKQAHDKVHVIANDIFIRYREGERDEARNDLTELQAAFDEMKTVLDLCD
jgi:hypothetical protein